MRKDLYLYNEATGWILTSACLNHSEELSTDDWDEEVARGTLIPMSLVQDDSLIIRVVANEPLTSQEDEEWLDRFEAKLSIPDGKLVLAAGIDYVESPEDCDEDYACHVDVDPGDYRVTVYTYFGGVNAPDTDDLDGEDIKKY